MAKRSASTGKPREPERPRGGRPRAVGEAVPDAGRAAFRRFGFVQSAIVSRWGEIVGERYAGVTAPESIRFPAGRRAEGTLCLAVDGAHATTIVHVVPTIIERVNRFFGYPAVARVQVRQGVARRAARRLPEIERPAPRPSAELGDSLRTIADPELRACLESLAAQMSLTAGLPLVPAPVRSADAS